MMSILILSVFVGQYAQPIGGPASLDLAFARGVEEFIVRSSPGRRPPEPYRSLITRLGSPAWKDREAASRELIDAISADRPAMRWLFWGRLDEDHEIGLRANAVIKRLNPCPSCGGRGGSKSWESWPCDECEGAGTSWPFSPWD